MSTRGADNATSIATALGWFGLGVIAFMVAWHVDGQYLPWYVKISGGIVGGLAFVGYGVEALSQELTIRRWAISQLIFTTAGVVFLIAAIFNANVLGMGRVVLLVLAAVYLFGAIVSAAAGKDLF